MTTVYLYIYNEFDDFTELSRIVLLTDPTFMYTMRVYLLMEGQKKRLY